MATRYAANPLSLLELARRTAPDGNTLRMIEVLTEENAILEDAVWDQANDTFSNVGVRRAYEPRGKWRSINEGIAPDSSQSETYVDTIGMLEDYSSTDVKLISNSPNPAEFRSNEDTAFINGMSKELAETIIYSNHYAYPKQPHGLAPRLASTTPDNVYDGSGTGSDVTSIYIVQWGIGKVRMIYPRNDPQYGLRANDMGEQLLMDSDGKMKKVMVTHFEAYCGLAVDNPKCIARYANIETSGSSNTFDEDGLITLLNKMTNRGMGGVIYANSTILTQMEIRMKDKSNVYFQPDEAFGKPIITFRGLPVKLVDQILDTETAI